MRIILLSILFSVTILFASAQGDTSFLMQGKILNQKDAPLPFAHIKVKKSLKGTISNINGEYELRVRPLDAVIVSCVGYKTALFYIPSDTKSNFFNKTKLTVDTILLDEAIIAPWPGTYTKLKEEIKKIAITDSLIFKNKEQFLLGANVINEYMAIGSDGMLSKTLPGPFSILHNTFGDKPKQYKKLKKDIRYSNEERIIEMKFNIEIVSRLTGLNDDKEILKFITFCNFPRDYLLNASSYSIAVDTKKKYAEFIKKKLKD